MKDVSGIVEGVPVDLSINPCYLEGLGREWEPGAG